MLYIVEVFVVAESVGRVNRLIRSTFALSAAGLAVWLRNDSKPHYFCILH